MDWTKPALAAAALLIAAAAALFGSGTMGYFFFATGTNSEVGMWTSADSYGGSLVPFLLENVTFFANFTDSATGSPISGGGTGCDAFFNISGNWEGPAAMAYNATSGFYEYRRTFNYIGNYSWNVSCDGSALGYDADLGGMDYVNVYRQEWWNKTWKYRVRIDVLTGGLDVTNWPIEREINFTSILGSFSDAGTLDDNSTRLIEYNTTGGALYEIPSQFDKGETYDGSQSASGTVVFILNGTNANNTLRSFYLYFDKTENGLKNPASYATNLTYTLNGGQIEINSSRLNFSIDTDRGENTAGLFQAKFRDPSQPVPFFISPTGADRTIEYNEYYNGTHNLSFDFTGGITVVPGPVRLTVMLQGDETVFGNASLKTGEGRMVKKYYIYNTAGAEQIGSFIRIEQNFTNYAPYAVYRSSTEAGSMAFDIARGWSAIGSSPSSDPYAGNETDPYSWYSIFSDGTEIVGIVNVNESSPGFYVMNSSLQGGRIGVHLVNTSVASGESITESIIFYAGRGGTTEFVNTRNAIRSPNEVTLGAGEPLAIVSYTQTDHAVYNRNETIVLMVNVTYDPHDMLDAVNVSLDNGTAGTADDMVVVMYDDGAHGDTIPGDNAFFGSYHVSVTETTGAWVATGLLYDANGVLLNQSAVNFTVTKSLYVNAVITNPQGEVSRPINATLDIMNYRQDTWQPGASVACAVFDDSVKLYDVAPENIHDYGNGSYTINFTAPGYFGLFTLNCSAARYGSDGYDTYDFTAEEIQTDADVAITPPSFTAGNVTWLYNQSFIMRVNASNTKNGTAYDASLSIQLPQNMTANATTGYCDDGEGGNNILISKSCVLDFNVTVIHGTAPSVLRINATASWTNFDTSSESNATYMNATVGPTYVLNITESFMASNVTSALQKTIGSFSVQSLGNVPLSDVTFNVTGMPQEFNFTFSPANFSSLAAGNTSAVNVSLLVAAGYSPGYYSGILNITSGNDGYSQIVVNITVGGTNVTLGITDFNFTAANITYYTSQNFTFGFGTNNTGNVTAYAVNITFEPTDALIYAANATPIQCGSLEPGEGCNGTIVLVVSNGTHSGNYSVNVSAVWQNPEIGTWYSLSIINVTVLSNVNLTIPQTSVSGNIVHNTSGVLGSFNMSSMGNDPVEGMAFTIGDAMGNFQDFNMAVVPNITATSGGNLSVGSALTVNVTADIPLSYPNGTYLGYLNVTTANAGYRQLDVSVTVPQTRTWVISPVSCEHPESPTEGTACNVTINNTGNVPISFSVQPPATGTSNLTMNNYTWPSSTSFVLQNQSSTVLSIYYNVTDAPLLFYNASYNITGLYASPGSWNISILLTPFVKPVLSYNVTPGVFPQFSTTEFFATVFDQGGVAGINFTTVNITRPGGSSDQMGMRRVAVSDDTYYYQEFYPSDPINGTWGSTATRGNYTFSIYAQDNLGLNETINGSFYVYPVPLVSVRTSRSSEYYQGETGTLLYTITDVAGYAMEGVNVTITIRDPYNRSVNFFNGNFLTNPQGEPDAYPYFDLFSDSPPGQYNITAASTYNETPVSQWISNISLVHFTVLERRPGLMTLDLEAPSDASTADGLIVYATVTDGSTNFDPDWIRVSLYDALENAILENVTMTRESVGRYRRWFNTSISVNTGPWRWNVTAADGSSSVTKDVFTRLVGGLFDVRDINPFDRSVTTLGISAVIENTGDIPQDAFIQWNLTRADTGESLTQGMDTVRIDPASEYTYTINPVTSYIGDVRIIFVVTYSGTEHAAAYEYFTTIPAEPTEPEEPGPGGGAKPPPEGGGAAGGPVGAPGIKIITYPAEIATEAGWTQYPSVTVNNTGSAPLHNVMVSIVGIPSSWYNVSPMLIPVMNPGATVTFVLNILVPPGTQAQEYYGIINATSAEAADEKMTTIIVFGSREDMVRYQLAKLKSEYAEFSDDVNATAKRGEKDLSRVYGVMDEIEHQIEMTEGYLDARMFNEALDAVTTGWRLLDRARDLLRDAPPLEPVTMLAIPDWMLTLILLLIIAILALAVFMNRYRKRLDKVFAFRKKAPASAADAMESAGEVLSGRMPSGPSKEDAAAAAAARRTEEKQKIEKVITLLEKEYKEGIISEKAYNDLRNRNLEKMKALGK